MKRILFYLFCILSSYAQAFEYDLPDGYEFADLEDFCFDEDEGLEKSTFKHPSKKDVPDSNLAMETLEAGPSGVVAGCVNAITGDFFDSHTSVTVPGALPLSVQCFYCSSEKEWNFQHMPDLEVGSSTKGNHLYARYLNDQGSGLTFRTYLDNKDIKGRQLIIPSNLFEKGLTNCGAGFISGKTNWRNSNVVMIKRHDKKSYMLTHGTGVSRIFFKNQDDDEKQGNYKKAPVGKFHLESENYPNGNRLLYKHKDDKLIRVKAVNGANQPLGSLHLSQKVKKEAQWISDSGHVTFTFEDNKRKLIKQINPTHAIPISYKYDKHRMLTRKDLPEGRFLKIKFHASGKEKRRVQQLSTPAGVTHTFQYNLEGETRVRDAEGNFTLYGYDKKTKRLQVVKQHDRESKLLSKNNFYWSNSENTAGNLIARTFEDNEKVYFSRVLDYDRFDNIKQDALFGNLTGTALQPIGLRDGYVLTTYSDVFVKTYEYSQDKRNQLLIENDGKKVIYYDYHPNQLLKARLTTDGSKILKREYFEYDGNGVLTTHIWDDGQALPHTDLSYVTERHVKIITPRAIYPVGLPQIVDEYYMDMASLQYCLLRKTVYHHDFQGNVLQEDYYGSDGNFAYSLKWDYNNLGKVTKKFDALGQTTTFCYDSNGNKIREDGPLLGWHKVFEYDRVNRLIKETEYWPDGTALATFHTYNSLNQRITTTNPQGNTTTFEYDVLGHLLKTQGPNLFIGPNHLINPFEETEYDAMGNAVVQKDANGYTTKTAYTIRGKPYRIEYPDGSIEQKEYSTSGLLVKEIARNGLTTQHTYDPFDRVISTVITDPQGNVLKTKSSSYSTFQLLSETDEDGMLTTYQYDGAGRRIAMKKGEHLTKYQLDSLGKVIKTIDFINDNKTRVTCKVYDLLDRVLEKRVEDGLGEVFEKEQYTYDANGNRTSITVFSQAGTATKKTEYTPDGKPLLITDASENQTRYDYDHHFFYKGQIVLAVTKIDPLGNRETTVHDTHGNISWRGQTDAFGRLLQQEASYYDPLGNKTHSEITVFEGQEIKRVIETSWKYDSMGNLIHCIEAVGTPEQKEVVHHYNSYGQKEKTDMPNGISIFHEYDSLGRLSSYYSTDKSISYQYIYDKKDHPILVKDLVHNTKTERSYDQYGRLKLETLDNGLTLSYTYDQLDRPLLVTLPDQSSLQYHYNAHHLIAIDRIKEGKIVYTHRYSHYDLAGNVIEETLLGKTGKIQYRHDLLERPISVRAPHWQETIPKDGFDSVGNLLKREVTDKQGSLTYTYAYDDLYQLSSEKGCISHTYNNDSVYNRTAKDDQPYTVNSLNQLLSQTNWSYHYDKNGNLIEKTADDDQICFVYDALDRLIEVHHGSDVTTYIYDSFHRRLSKTHKGLTTRFLYQNQNEIGAFCNGEMVQLRVLGVTSGAEIGAAIALELNDKIYAPIHDPQGNIVALLDPSGNFVEGYRYSAFGETQVFCENAVTNPWRYSSKRLDSETGFLFFGRRYYDPDIGRWITPDPAGYADGPNLYAYVHNKPLIYIDPDGQFAEAIYQATAAAATSFSEGMQFGAAGGKFTHEGEIFSAARENNNPSIFTMGAMIAATTSPINNAIKTTMDFLHSDSRGAALGTIPYSPGGSACIIKSFLQGAKSSETFLSQVQQIQRTQTAVFDSLKISTSANSRILFGQKSVSPYFSKNGYFNSKPISEVVKELKNGTITPNQLPINFITKEGQKIALNNRSLLALKRAGKEPTILIDRTGNTHYENLLIEHLRGAQPSNVIRVRGE